MVRRTSLKPGMIVEMVWKDAFGSEGWIPLETTLGPLPSVHTVGVVLENTEEFLKVRLSQNQETQDIAGWIAPAWNMIRTVYVLERRVAKRSPKKNPVTPVACPDVLVVDRQALHDALGDSVGDSDRQGLSPNACD